jgi:hypothetical protein
MFYFSIENTFYLYVLNSHASLHASLSVCGCGCGCGCGWVGGWVGACVRGCCLLSASDLRRVKAKELEQAEEQTTEKVRETQ